MKHLNFNTNAKSYYQLIVILFLTTNYANAQFQNLNVSKETGAQFFQESGRYYDQDSLAQALLAGYKSLYVAQELEDEQLMCRSYMRIFQAQYKGESYQMALSTANLAVAAAPNDTLRYRNYYNLGLAYIRLNRPDSALYYFGSAYQYFLDVKDHKRVAQCLNEMGLAYFYGNDYVTARKYYAELVDFATAFELPNYIGYGLNNIANSYISEGKNDSATHYLMAAIPYKSGRGLFTTYYNLARVSNDPYPYLIRAKDASAATLDGVDLLAVLQELRRYHSGDSNNYYATAIADLVMQRTTNTAEIVAGKKYELQAIEHAMKVAHLKTERSQERKRWIVGTLTILITFIGLLMGGAYLAKRKWVPELMRKRNEMLEYENVEMMRTISQLQRL